MREHMLTRGKELSTASARAHPSWYRDGPICDGGALCQCNFCASLGSPCVRVRAGVSQGFQLSRCLKEQKRRNYGCSEAMTRLVVLRGCASLQNVFAW